jgi:hypothetical protein
MTANSRHHPHAFATLDMALDVAHALRARYGYAVLVVKAPRGAHGQTYNLQVTNPHDGAMRYYFTPADAYLPTPDQPAWRSTSPLRRFPAARQS